MKAFEALTQTLIDNKVRTIFGLMGDANMYFLAHWIDKLGGHYIGSVHEGPSVSMGDGYYRATGDMAVASVTHGPGFANTITALVSAARNRSKVLVLTGDPDPDPTHTQRIDIAALVAPTGAGYEEVISGATTFRDVQRAIHRVHAERRPIVLNFPSAVMEDEADEDLRFMPPQLATGILSADDDSIDRALGLLAHAQRPLLLAGRGVTSAGARQEVIDLADHLGAPLATSLFGRDQFHGHPFDVGICGNLATGIGSEIIADSDCIVAIGASLDRRTTMMGSLLDGKRVIQNVLDPTTVATYLRVDETVIGDAKDVTARMLAALREAGIEGSGWRERYRDRLAAWKPTDDFTDRSEGATVDARAAAIRLDKLVPANRRFVSDTGRFHTIRRYTHVEHPALFTHMSNFGSIGLGLSASIGAAVGDPARPTVLVAGDGGFMMYVSELATAARYNLPMLIAVFNDHSYGMEYTKLIAHGDNPAHSLLPWPDLVTLAKAYGADGHTVTSISDLDNVPQIVDDLRGPYLLDIRIDPAVEISSP